MRLINDGFDNKHSFEIKKWKEIKSGFTHFSENDVVVALPPLAEQKRIVEKVDSLMQLCDELEKKIEKSKDYSNRLMESILKSSF